MLLVRVLDYVVILDEGKAAPATSKPSFPAKQELYIRWSGRPILPL